MRIEFLVRQERLALTFLVILSQGLASGPVKALDDPAADYELLRQGRYTTAAVPIPAAGLTFRQGEATWTLASGHVRFLEPLADGSVTGLVFEGEGLFHMPIADPVERAQWSRSAERPGQGEIDESFSHMVLRTTSKLVFELFELPPNAAYEPDRGAQKRHENWLVQRFHDVDARVVCGLLIPGDEYLRAEMKTDSFDWLTFELDSMRQEEILVSRYDPVHSFVEDWVSLDRIEDRHEGGRPSRQRRSLIDLRHVDVEIDITKAGRDPRAGVNEIHPRRVRFRAALTFVPHVDGLAALPLTLSSWSEVLAVTTAAGESLAFLRDHVGSRSSALDRRLYDGSLVIVLDQPLVAGEERSLMVEYERDLLNYAAGRNWYPGEDDSLRDVHTATLTITARKKDDVRAMGKLREERDEEKTQVQVWSLDRPTKMVTFSFAEQFHEETLKVDGVPEVIAFSANSGSKNKTYNVAADMINSLTYFQALFADPLPIEQLYVTSIVGSHGQAFDGFIHLSELSFESESEGPTQLFRAHEAAHQWWGHQVVWSSYRDQWLSEGFAEYSAMLFIESTMKKGKDYYDEIVEAYTGQMIGLTKPNRFARFPLESNDKFRQRIGPISIGYRASTADSPGGYTAQAYFKGALTLHMLRGLIRGMTKSDELFVQVLRDFLAGHRGGEASTADFVAVLNRRVPMREGWDWFFDQWVHGTAIPTYAWSYQVSSKPNADGKYLLELEVEQSDVPAGFRMPVPVRVEFGKDAEGQVLVLVDEPKKTLTIPLPQKPKKVTFNPDGAVLARMKKKR